MGSGEPEVGEMDTETFQRALKELADWGVFHVALGGGEVLGRSDLFELAEYARDLGLVPNLTTSGSLLSADPAARMMVFGQVNVSLDGVGSFRGVYRDAELFDAADRAIDLLVDAGVPTGINCVLGRRNFDGLADLAGYAKGKGVNEIEFLRFKPAGRGTSMYQEEKTTYEQNVRLIPLLMELSQTHGLCMKIDCSFMPMMCYHKPPREVLETTAAYGCEAANVLLGIRSDGSAAGCSFLPGAGISIFQLRESWEAHEEFIRYRTWVEKAPEPCRECDYLDICKGGCHAVAAFVTGSIDHPDPDCPWVVEHAREGKSG
jgi:radical SAM protein with 4Fe4S-binding SPASM domain